MKLLAESFQMLYTIAAFAFMGFVASNFNLHIAVVGGLIGFASAILDLKMDRRTAVLEEQILELKKLIKKK